MRKEYSQNLAFSNKCFDQSINRDCFWSVTKIIPPLLLILLLHLGSPQSSVVGERFYSFGYLWVMSVAMLAFSTQIIVGNTQRLNRKFI